MVEIHGDVTPGFGAVADAFAENFARHGEVGAGVAIYLDGHPVVELWGGSDAVRARPFTEDSLVVVQSATKGATATCLALLVQRGLLDPDAPVAAYWPEFGQAGKQDIPVRWVLGHLAGLPDVDPSAGLRGLATMTGPALVDALAGAEPWWVPGTAWAYHATTFGTLAGELVRRVTGTSIGQFLATEIAAPLGLDFWIGLPERHHHRVAPAGPPAGAGGPDLAAVEPGTVRHRIAQAALASFAAFHAATDPADPRAWRAYLAAEIPAAGGVTNARSLARMYAATVSEVDGVRLLTDATVDRARAPQTDGVANVGLFGAQFRYGWGFQLPSPTMPGLTARSFGHPGAGGHLGFADPQHRVGFGYVCTSPRWPGADSDPRWLNLLAALRAALA